MAHMNIYAGAAADNMSLLPSPVDVKPSEEIIWSENTGRAQSGANKARMIGDVVAEKTTYTIQWGMLTRTELNLIKSKLKAGFFWFGMGTTAASAEEHASKFYRGNIVAELVQAGGTTYYKNTEVTIIEQ